MPFENNAIYLSQTFNEIDASNFELEGIEFDDCTFIKCDFSDGFFKKCKLSDCSFEHCNLSNIKVNYSRFLNVNFEHCKLIGVDWSKAHWPNITSFAALKFQQCILNYSSFFALHLQEITIEECKAHEVDFRSGNFTDANLSYTNFTGALFNHTKLNRCNFKEASHYHIDVLNNDIHGAKFCRFEAVSLLESLGIELLD